MKLRHSRKASQSQGTNLLFPSQVAPELEGPPGGLSKVEKRSPRNWVWDTARAKQTLHPTPREGIDF